MWGWENLVQFTQRSKQNLKEAQVEMMKLLEFTVDKTVNVYRISE